MRTVKTTLSETALAKSFAVLGFAGYVLCILGTVLFPEFLMTLFNSWFHGVDISILKPADGNWIFGTGNLLLGLLTFPIISWFTGYFVAFLYNKYNK